MNNEKGRFNFFNPNMKVPETKEDWKNFTGMIASIRQQQYQKLLALKQIKSSELEELPTDHDRIKRTGTLITIVEETIRMLEELERISRQKMGEL